MPSDTVVARLMRITDNIMGQYIMSLNAELALLDPYGYTFRADLYRIFPLPGETITSFIIRVLIPVIAVDGVITVTEEYKAMLIAVINNATRNLGRAITTNYPRTEEQARAIAAPMYLSSWLPTWSYNNITITFVFNQL